MILTNAFLLIYGLVIVEKLVLAFQSDPVKVDGLLQVFESLKPIKCNDADDIDLFPESKLIGIQFSNPTIDNKLNKLGSKSIQSFNSSKQSQDFDTHQEVLKPNTSTPETSTQHSSSTSTTTTSNPTTPKLYDLAYSTTTTSTDYSSTTESSSVSRVVRQGSAISCGEANPNGKSNNKLVQERIVGGHKSEPGEFPFQVRLNIRARRGSGICGGVILDEKHLLTAAHCVTSCSSRYLDTVSIRTTEIQATLGDHSIKSSDGELEIGIEKITPHENYDACNYNSNDHDIALIRTATPLLYRFTLDGYGSINRPCLPVSKDTAYKEGEAVIVSGWGVTRDNSVSLSNILRFVQVSVVNVSSCQETYGDRVTKNHVCAGYPTGGKDSCQGDSGGPLVRVLDNRYELVGIVSFGFGCGQPGAPGVYTRVASYIDWIKSNM